MSSFVTLLMKETKALFTSTIAYVLIAVFLLLTRNRKPARRIIKRP